MFSQAVRHAAGRTARSRGFGGPMALVRATPSGSRCNSSSYPAQAAPAGGAGHGPLKGVRVLDMSRVLAGPFCTQILADFGADVVKIEQPGTGDDTRYWRIEGEGDQWEADDMSNYFSAVNRNKRSVTIDLKQEAGKDLIREMVKNSDILVENFIPGKMEQLGLSYAQLSAINPSLIYASISGYGPTGPYAKRAGYDIIAAASAGLLHITGEPDGPPTKPGVALVDISTGLYTHGAILAALHARTLTGRGQHVTSSLFESQIGVLTSVALGWLNAGQEAKRMGTGHPSIVPYEAFPTSDSYFVCGAVNNRQFKNLCTLVEHEGLATDERFATNDARIANRAELKGLLSDYFKAKKTAEWMEIFEGSGMPYAEVNGMEGAFAHPQTAARDMVEEVAFDGCKKGVLKLVGIPVKFSDTKATVRTRPPRLGEHTEEVLGELGFSTKQIAGLRSDGTV